MMGAIEVSHKKAMKDLLRIDTVRGAHSVGVYATGMVKESLFKKALSPDEMFSMKGWDDLYNASSNLYIGHNRWATQGAVNSLNAHPFEQGIIIGAHNGTLRQQNLLPDSQLFDVDSENIMYSLHKDGVDETVKKLNGAYALTWYNTEERTINFLRNDERTLYYCYSLDHRTMFWASESWMLYGALGRNGIKITEPKMFEIDKHYSIVVPESYPAQCPVLERLNIKEVIPYKNKPTVRGNVNGNRNHNVYGLPIGFTGKDRIKIGDLVYFWQGHIHRDGNFMLCPAETNEPCYDVRVPISKGGKTREVLTDDFYADCIYQAVVTGTMEGKLPIPALLVNPNTVARVDEKKQADLLRASTV